MLNKIKVLIAEDDKNSSDILGEFLQQAADFELIGFAENGEELVELNFNLKPDLVLADVEMPVLNGIESIRECVKTNPSLHYIFTTGHERYAVEAFNISAVDYLVKPIKKSRLYEALDKVKSIRALETLNSQNNEQVNKKLIVKSDSTLHVVEADSILFIEKMNRKTLLHTREQTYESYETLDNFKKVLQNNFFLSHRSYIINLNHVSSIKNAGETHLVHFHQFEKYAHVSKLRYAELQERLKG